MQPTQGRPIWAQSVDSKVYGKALKDITRHYQATSPKFPQKSHNSSPDEIAHGTVCCGCLNLKAAKLKEPETPQTLESHKAFAAEACGTAIPKLVLCFENLRSGLIQGLWRAAQALCRHRKSRAEAGNRIRYRNTGSRQILQDYTPSQQNGNEPTRAAPDTAVVCYMPSMCCWSEAKMLLESGFG